MSGQVDVTVCPVEGTQSLDQPPNVEKCECGENNVTY